MLVLTCPVCGIKGQEADFHCGGEAHIVRPQSKDPDAVSDEALRDYLYIRKNPRGLHREMWHCTRGCGKWFNAVRDTTTLEFKAFYRMDQKPPRLEKFSPRPDKAAPKPKKPVKGTP